MKVSKSVNKALAKAESQVKAARALAEYEKELASFKKTKGAARAEHRKDALQAYKTAVQSGAKVRCDSELLKD